MLLSQYLVVWHVCFPRFGGFTFWCPTIFSPTNYLANTLVLQYFVSYNVGVPLFGFQTSWCPTSCFGKPTAPCPWHLQSWEHVAEYLVSYHVGISIVRVLTYCDPTVEVVTWWCPNMLVWAMCCPWNQQSGEHLSPLDNFRGFFMVHWFLTKFILQVPSVNKIKF